MTREAERARRLQIESMVEDKLHKRVSLSDKSHEIFQLVASNNPFIIVRSSEERRVVDNFSLIGYVANKEVYNWSLTSGLYRNIPCTESLSRQVSEEMRMTNEQRAASGGLTGLGLLLYYLRDIWQHPLLGAFSNQNPTYSNNRTDLAMADSRGSVFILKDAHMFLSSAQSPVNVRVLKDLIESIQWQKHNRQPNGSTYDRSLRGMSIVITAPLSWEIPVEIRDLATDMIFPRPNADEFRDVIYGDMLPEDAPDSLREQMRAQEGRILHAATGLHAKTFIDALKVSGIEQILQGHDPFDIRDDIISGSKKQAIKAGGAIIYEDPDWTMDDVGGHDNLKSYLRARSVFFDPENPIQDRMPTGVTLPMPKGVLMVGIPGCGKSLEAKAMASMLNVPLLTLDMGAVFTGIVGGSEGRMRDALQLAEECAPCVLRIEEIEKALSGSGSSNMSDGGTTNRVFQTVLNWLQEHDAPVYVVATANDVAQLPSELLRKGRFDEIFFVDLPVAEERDEIFRIHLRKWAGLTEEQIAANFDIAALSALTENFSGAEIESLVKDSLYRAVAEFDAAESGTDFVFNGQHIRDTIGTEGNRTYRILFDSERDKLERLRNVARDSWANASTHVSVGAASPTVVSGNVPAEDRIAADWFNSSSGN